MTNFKVGDKVKRISGNDFPEYNMTRGGIYTVKEVNFPFFLKLEGAGDDKWYTTHFELVEEKQEYPNPPHVHLDLIIAWANGAEIEFYLEAYDCWHTVANPSWDRSTSYRIKPNKSAKDVEIERIQDELDKLSKRLEELKGEGK